MVWQVLAMWAVVLTTIIWFVRDERRLRAQAALARSARYYAHAPKYRHQPSRAVLPPPPRLARGGLSETQRAFLKALAQKA